MPWISKSLIMGLIEEEIGKRKQSLSYEISHFPADFGGAHHSSAWLHV